ncbi:unnamed protein product, partial [Brassica napus]
FGQPSRLIYFNWQFISLESKLQMLKRFLDLANTLA